LISECKKKKKPAIQPIPYSSVKILKRIIGLIAHKTTKLPKVTERNSKHKDLTPNPNINKKKNFRK
jgi:hypothetical protein